MKLLKFRKYLKDHGCSIKLHGGKLIISKGELSTSIDIVDELKSLDPNLIKEVCNALDIPSP